MSEDGYKEPGNSPEKQKGPVVKGHGEGVARCGAQRALDVCMWPRAAAVTWRLVRRRINISLKHCFTLLTQFKKAASYPTVRL